MAQQSQNQKQISVASEKAAHLEAIAKLSVESLAILAEKSKKEGIEQKLKMFQNFI